MDIPNVVQTLLAAFSFTLFDQLARVAFQQYILWATGEPVKSTVIRLVFYGILAVRLLAGGVLLGFTRPEFSTTCVARRSNIYGSVLVLALDGVIMVILATRIVVAIKRQDKSNVSVQALIFGIFGFMIWTGTSAPMILGFPEFMLLLKTLLPAIGVLIIIGIITLFPGYYVTQSQDVASTMGASSPYSGPVFPSQNTVKASAGSLSSGYMQSRNLYVVNPSTPNDFQTPLGSSRGIMKTNENTPQNSVVNMSGNNDSVLTFLNNAKLRKNSANDSSQSLSSYTPGYRGSSGIFPPQGNTQAALAPAIVGLSGPNAMAASSTDTLLSGKRNILKWPLKMYPEKQSVRNLPISNPISIEQKEKDLQYFVRMPTVELEQAIFNERQRKDAEAAKSYLIANSLTPKPSTLPREYSEPKDENSPTKLMITKVTDKLSPDDDKEISIPSTKLDELVIASEVNTNQDIKTAPIYTPKSPSYSAKKVPDYNYETSRTTSVLPSPIPDELRRRSPMNKANLSSPVKSALAFSPKDFLQPIQNSQNSQQQELPGIETNGTRGTERIMLVNEIIYDRPDLIENIMKDISGQNSSVLRGYSNMLEEYPDKSEKQPDNLGAKNINTENQIYCTIIDEPVPQPSVIDRPRPIERRISRIISSGRRRSKSLGAIKLRTTMTESDTIDLDPSSLPPPLPTRAANLKPLLHQDTNDMAREEERMKYLFPAPPTAPRTVTRHKRNLSLPSLAHMPSYQSFDFHTYNLDESSKIQMKLEGSEKVLEFVNESSKPTFQNTIHSHQNQSQVNLGSLVPENLNVPPNSSQLSNIFANAPKQISTYEENTHKYQSSSNQTPIQDDTIDWGWVAELDPLEIPKNHSSSSANNSVVNVGDSQTLSINSRTEDQKIVTVMLETQIQNNDEWSRNQSPAAMLMPIGNSQLTSTNQKERKITAAKVNQKNRRRIAEARDSWYFRVGERMPSFSGKRNEVFQTNKTPPRLILDRNKIATIPKAKNSELTPPHYSYESAYTGIESPLSKLDEKNPGSIESLMQRISKISLQGDDTEISLLETLKMEMEEQSNQWQNLQSNFDRDSIISILSQLPIESLQDSKILHRSSEIDDNLGPRASHLSTLSNLSKQLSTDTWQQELAEAQISYTKLYNQRPNHFKYSNYQISSPTPPESIDSENDNISEFEDEDETPRQSSINILNRNNSLWHPASLSYHKRHNSMWNTSDRSSMFTDITPPAADLRPSKRFTEQSLLIKSHSLWSKKYGGKFQSSSSWLSKIEDQKIYQNPREEFNNLEHVDIIQDSEGKDRAHINTMGNEYEDMEDFGDYEEKFDESTLLKIAALLKTNNLPSNKSLLPPRREDHSEGCHDDFPEEELSNLISILPLAINENFSALDTEDSQVDHSINIINKSTIEYENFNQFAEAGEVSRNTSHLKTDEEISKSMLWNHNYSLDITIQSVGLQQPSPEIWGALNIMPESVYRSKSKKLDSNLLKFENDKLWAKPLERPKVQEITQMWINFQNFNARNISTVKSTVNANEKTFSANLWTRRYPKNTIIQSVGLQQPSPQAWRAFILMLKDAPRSKPRIPDSNIPKLKTHSLWTKPQYILLAQGTSALWEKSQSLVAKEKSRRNSFLIAEEIDSQLTIGYQIMESPINQKPIANINSKIQSLFVIDAENDFESKKDLQPTKIRNEVRERSQFETTEISFKSMLWNPGHESDNACDSLGLQQPSPEIWKALTVTSESFFWSKSKQIDTTSLPKFGSENLWVKKQQVMTLKNETRTMWITKHNSINEDICKVNSVMKSNSDSNEKMIYTKLWGEKHPVDLVIRSVGLQQPSPEVWKALTVMSERHSKSKPRVSISSLPMLKTDKLWSKQQNIKAKKNDTSGIWKSEKVRESEDISKAKSRINFTLWTPRNHENIKMRIFGLQQPSPEVWKALTVMPERHSKSKPSVSISSLPILKTDNLWTKKQKLETDDKDASGVWTNEKVLQAREKPEVKSQVYSTVRTFNTMLWTQKHSLNTTTRSFGIQQPSPEVWKALTVMPERHSKSKPRVSISSLPMLKTDKLWSKQQNIMAKKNDTSGIWKSEKVRESEDISKAKSRINFTENNLNFTLWTPRNHENIKMRIFGLQQPSPETWKALKYIPEDLPRYKLKISGYDLASLEKDSLRSLQLSSAKLWSFSENSNEEINWISRCHMLDQKSNSELTHKDNNYLWQKKTVISKTSFIGINKSSNFGAYICQTEAMSNAFYTNYKSNYPKLPLDQLTSKKLWKKSINIPIQRDWISESSVRPESPTFSASSSLPSSPISDASSIFSISTKASSIWAVQEMPSFPVVSYIYPSISDRNSLEIKSTYDGHRISKSSIGPKISRPTPLAAVLESNQQFPQKIRKTEDNQAPKYTVSTSKKYQKNAASEYHNNQTTRKNSSSSKSKSNHPLTRAFAASPAEWKLALTEAILAGNSATL
ncbi:hypothetical protein OnM2_052002 [Erysiphe neolycopersici]|uniref:Uncharacterized protein n=1 Tax=Erysiphe neolycopersici TaxID=212602 RepID=A0A420HS61_9PEZI|nr:hypothetical protein OnM2_052002 [Erysiphe neolycopersici]